MTWGAGGIGAETRGIHHDETMPGWVTTRYNQGLLQNRFARSAKGAENRSPPVCAGVAQPPFGRRRSAT